MLNGRQLRKLREDNKVSQARLAEITETPQHLLSAFELEKSSLEEHYLNKIKNFFSNIKEYENVRFRKKRYKQHTYSRAIPKNNRSSNYKKTNRNSEYITLLDQLVNYQEYNQTYNAVSFFSGIGGFSLGFKSAGFKLRGFVEIDDDLASIYQKNFPESNRIGADISDIDDSVFQKLKLDAGEIDVVIGGPPCQGFSLSGKRDISDPRNYLFNEYLRAIKILLPKVAIVENVRLLTSMKSKDGSLVKDEILAGLSAIGYRSKIFEVNAKEFSVPQHRERALFIAVRQDLNIEPTLPERSCSDQPELFGAERPYFTFGDACSDLDFIESGGQSIDPHHKAVSHPDHVIRWLWDVPQGKSAHDNDDADLRPPSGYNTTYKRQVWNQPAATVQTTFGMISGCRNVHPIATRSLTIREASRLQSFPDTFQFAGSLGKIRTGIGNAVPPLLARALALHVRASLTDLVEISRLEVEL